MSVNLDLSRSQLHTLEHIFQHPLAQNLEWREIVSLFEKVGQAEQEQNNHLIVTVNGETRTFHRPQHKDIANDQEVLDIRSFLKKVGITPQTQQSKP